MAFSNLPAAPLVPPPVVAPGTPHRGMTEFDLAGSDSGLDWRRILSALLRFKWLIAGFTLVGTVAGVGATRFLKPEYAAQAKIWIDVEGRRGPDRGPAPIRPSQLLDAESWVDLLKSYVVLDQVVRDERLFVDPSSPADAQALEGLRVADQYRPGAYRFTVDHAGQGYTLATADGIELERGTLGDSVGTRYGLQWAPDAGSVAPGRTVEFTLTTLRDAATGLGEALDVRMDMDGNFLRFELRGPYPTRITAIVNAVAQRYVQVYADLKRQKVIELTKILGEQVQHSQENLRNAEAALQRFREETITLPSDRPAAGGCCRRDAGSGVRRLLRDAADAGGGAARSGGPGPAAGAGRRLGALGRGAVGGRLGATESRAVGGVEGADGQASPAAHLSLQVLRRVPAGAAAAGGDRDAAASDDPDAGARARRTARGEGSGAGPTGRCRLAQPAADSRAHHRRSAPPPGREPRGKSVHESPAEVRRGAAGGSQHPRGRPRPRFRGRAAAAGEEHSTAGDSHGVLRQLRAGGDGGRPDRSDRPARPLPRSGVTRDGTHHSGRRAARATGRAAYAAQRAARPAA